MKPIKIAEFLAETFKTGLGIIYFKFGKIIAVKPDCDTWQNYMS